MKAPPHPRPSPVPPPDSAMASTTGKYSGLQPAMTAFTATCSTVAVRNMGMNCTTSPFFLVNPADDVPHAAHLNVPLEGDHLIRFVAGALQHGGDPLFGGDDDGHAVGIHGIGGIQNARNILGLLVELLGFGKRAFEEYPGLLGRPAAPSVSPLRSKAGSGHRAGGA